MRWDSIGSGKMEARKSKLNVFRPVPTTGQRPNRPTGRVLLTHPSVRAMPFALSLKGFEV